MLKYQIELPTVPADMFASVLKLAEQNSDKWANNTSKNLSRAMGQVFTPISMAHQLVSLVPENNLSQLSSSVIADPGAGTGMLSTSLAARLQSHNPSPLSVLGFETDLRLKADWHQVWEFFIKQSEQSVDVSLLEDFTVHAESALKSGLIHGLNNPDFITTNPPYIKLSKQSELAKVFYRHGVPIPNLYAAFIAIACSWVKPDGHVLCICPRSFASGDYFSHFRKWLNERMSVEHVVLFRSRSNFKNVLQETVLIYLKNSSQTKRVRITVADTPTSNPEYDIILPAEDIISDAGWWLPRSAADIELINKNKHRPHTLASLGINVSTGKIEMHRLTGTVQAKAIYAKDFDARGEWTWGETRKPRYVKAKPQQLLALPEHGGYVVLKRISSNDGSNPQRLLPAWLSQESARASWVGIDNHIQYLHRAGNALTHSEGLRLIEQLQCDEAQAVMRAIAGTTQVNRSDLQKLRFDEI